MVDYHDMTRTDRFRIQYSNETLRQFGGPALQAESAEAQTPIFVGTDVLDERARQAAFAELTAETPLAKGGDE